MEITKTLNSKEITKAGDISVYRDTTFIYYHGNIELSF